MEKRYQVFVSSTFTDLREERQEVIQALLELDCIPNAMEFFTASTEESWDVIRSVLRTCDYYVLIVAGRYGSVTEEGISFTEKEYDLALELNIPVLAFPHADPDQLPKGKSEANPKLARKLEAFRKRIGVHSWKAWTSAAELGGHVSRAMVKALRQYPRPGWVRADAAQQSPELLMKLSAAHDKIDQLERRLAEFQQASIDPQQLRRLQEYAEISYQATGTDSDGSVRAWIGKGHISWREVFATLLAEAIVERDEGELLHCLNRALGHHAGRPGYKVKWIEISRSSWNNVKIRALALGYVEIGVLGQVAGKVTLVNTRLGTGVAYALASDDDD